jgi:tRNA-dihydrouridine synthase A
MSLTNTVVFFIEPWWYNEINLNCGCLFDRVQKGAFGACLMANYAI